MISRYIILAVIIAVVNHAWGSRIQRPPDVKPQTSAPPPRFRPSNPPQQTPPNLASQSCKLALGHLYNQTTACFGLIPPSPNQTFKSNWCSDSGCRANIRNQVSIVLGQCTKNDGAQDMIATIQSRTENMVQYLCPAQDSCPGNSDLLSKIANQGPPTTTMLNSVCQPCALKNLGQQTRDQMMNRNGPPVDHIPQFNQIAQAKAICDTADGEYCSPQILSFNGSQPEQLCSLCFRKYFAKMAFTGNRTTEKINPYQRFGELLDHGCIHDENDKPCIKRLALLLSVSNPVLANLSAQAPSRPLQQCLSGCDQNCLRFLNNTATKAGNCSAALKPFVKFLGVNLPDTCFGNLSIPPPSYSKTIQRLTWVIKTNDTATNICNQLTLDMATNFGMDRNKISCMPQPNAMFARRLLSNTRTVTTTSSDYSSDGSSSQSTFTPDTVNGEVVSVSDATATTMSPGTANPQDVSTPTTAPTSTPSTPTSTTPTPSTTSTNSPASKSTKSIALITLPIIFSLIL